MKKVLSLLLALITVFSLSACFENLDNSKVDVEKYLNVDLNNKITIHTWYPNSGMSDTQFKNSRTTRYFEEITGYKATYFQNIGAEETGEINLILTNQKEYDMLKVEHSTWAALVNDESFVDLKPFLEKYGQNLLKTIPQAAWDAVTIDGKIYAVPEAGFGGMLGNALVWDLEQLAAVGITKIPETIGEVDAAFHALQDHFGSQGNKYNAFSMQGAQAYISTLAAAFDLPQDFFIDDDDQIKHVMYHPNFRNYSDWMYGLVKSKIIPQEWKSYTGAEMIGDLATGKLGCAYMPYWNINALVERIKANKGYTDEEARASIGWSLLVRGDGACGSAVQEEAKYVSYNSIGYCITVPHHRIASTAYVIDWMDKRITAEAFEGYRLGDEGVHFNYSTSADSNAIEVMIGGEKKYVTLTPQYAEDILPTSMYQTGVNPEVGRNLWVLSEKSYNAWNVMVDFDGPNALGNALGMVPYIEGWSEVDIASRSYVLTLQQQMYLAKTQDGYERILNNLTNAWESEYWKPEVNANVQAWYQSTK